MNLEKKIVYIDCFENYEKIKNVGHVKIWIRDQNCIMDLHIKGLHETDTLMAEMKGIEEQVEEQVEEQIGEQISIGRICIDKGAAYFNSTFPMDNIDGQGNGFNDIKGLRIKISDTRYLEGRWDEESSEKEKNKTIEFRPREKIENLKPIGLQSIGSNSIELNNIEPKSIELENMESKYMDSKNIRKKLKIEKEYDEIKSNDKKCNKKGNRNSVIEFVNTMNEQQISATEHSTTMEENCMYDDKWIQLCHSYAVIHPFVNQEYISIQPKDFTILRKEYQQLVNNSFLLHGFYNYRHIILGKCEKKGKEIYLLGVPGTYYEREKMAAIMFGFESFEVSEHEFSDDFIEEGTFGYYLRTVDI